MGKVVGETFSNKVMLLQSSETVLKDRAVGAFVERLQEFAECVCFLPGNAHQVRRGVEVKGFCWSTIWSCCNCNGHTFTARVVFASEVPLSRHISSQRSRSSRTSAGGLSHS